MPAPTRDPWFDNAKMALVLLVVVGHAWTLLPAGGLTGRLYDFLYAWHMPAFVVVTGYLSRSFSWQGPRLWRLVRTVAVPYVVFETALALFRVHVGGEQLEDLYRDPHWPMWFLAALFFWRLMTPVFTALPRPAALGLAVALSLAAGLWAGDTLDVARVFGLLPFFVLGLIATPERLERLRTAPAQVAAVAMMASIAVLMSWLDTWASTEWLYYRSRYGELVSSDLEAVAIRATLLTIGALGALSFLALVPRVRGWFTVMGASTLVVYLFHGFVVKSAEYAGYQGWSGDHPGLALAVTTATGAVLALLLAWRPVASRLEPLVDPFGAAERQVDRAHELQAARAEADALVETLQESLAEDAARGSRSPQPAGSR